MMSISFAYGAEEVNKLDAYLTDLSALRTVDFKIIWKICSFNSFCIIDNDFEDVCPLRLAAAELPSKILIG
jgi:hypothetical protein